MMPDLNKPVPPCFHPIQDSIDGKSRASLRELMPAISAELRPRRLRSTLRAKSRPLLNRLAALRTEFRAPHVRSAVFTKGLGLFDIGGRCSARDVRARAHVHVLHVVCLAGLVPQLLPGGLGLSLSLVRRHLLVEIRRAVLALIDFLVPTNLFANPYPATCALAEVRTRFLHRLGER